MGFTKLHASIIHSSVWQEPPETRVVWVTMLAMADASGVVAASVGGLARAANVTREQCEAALACFLAPDPDSRDGTSGERIERVPGGWFLINHANYREKQTREQELAAARTRRWRERRHNVTEDDVTLRDVTSRNGNPASASASASAERESAERESPKPDPLEGFDEFWAIYDHKVGRLPAQKAWKAARATKSTRPLIIAKARAYVAATPDKAFRKHPATWLRARGWEDEDLPASPKPAGSKPATHIQNMPLGTASCGCRECVAFRSKRGESA